MSPALYCPDHWLNALPEKNASLLSREEIFCLNREISRLPATGCADLHTFPSRIPGRTISSWIQSLWPVIRELSLPPACEQSLLDRCFLPPEEALIPVRAGVFVQNASLRALPTPLSSFELTGKDADFDLLAQTTGKTWEPLLSLCAARDGSWQFVRTFSSMGWVESRHIAFCSREDWPKEEDSLLIAGSVLAPDFAPLLTMGTRLPLTWKEERAGCHTVLLPRRGISGQLETRVEFIPFGYDVQPGSLPLTQENLFRQLFKLAGHRYRWSGLWDCSALVQDVFACFGLTLPRNTAQQVSIPCPTWNLRGKPAKEKAALLSRLPPGTLLYMDGHVMILLGQEEGRPMVLHALWECLSPQGEPLFFGCAAVTGLELLRIRGGTFLEGLTAAKLLWPP